MGFRSGVFGGWTGHSRDVGQTMWRSLGHRRAATIQQELSVVDDPGTFGQDKQNVGHQRSCIIKHAGEKLIHLFLFDTSHI